MAEAEAKAAEESGRVLVRYEAAEGVAVLTLDDRREHVHGRMCGRLDEAVLRAR